MDRHTKKMIAPVIIIAILIAYYAGFFILCMSTIPSALKLLFGLVPLLLIGVSIYVLIERIKEIRSGEEDDLSKY